MSKSYILNQLDTYNIIKSRVVDMANEFMKLRGLNWSVSSFELPEELDDPDSVITLWFEFGYDSLEEKKMPVEWLWDDGWRNKVEAFVDAEKEEFEREEAEWRERVLSQYHTYAPTLQQHYRRQFNLNSKEIKDAKAKSTS